MFFAMQKTDIHVFELFYKTSHFRDSMHKITFLELLRTPILCLVHLSKLRKCDASNAEKILSEWVKAVNCNVKSKDQLYKNCLFSLKLNVFCSADARYSCF